MDLSTFWKKSVCCCEQCKEWGGGDIFDCNSLNCISCRETIVHSMTLYVRWSLFHIEMKYKIFILGISPLVSLFPYFITLSRHIAFYQEGWRYLDIKCYQKGLFSSRCVQFSREAPSEIKPVNSFWVTAFEEGLNCFMKISLLFVRCMQHIQHP